MINDISFRAYYLELPTVFGDDNKPVPEKLLDECRDWAKQRSKLRNTDGAERHKLKKLRRGKR